MTRTGNWAIAVGVSRETKRDTSRNGSPTQVSRVISLDGSSQKTEKRVNRKET